MWTRNLLFISLMLASAVTLASRLFPPPPTRVVRDSASRSQEPLPLVVAEVNREFRRDWTEAGLKPAGPATELAMLRRITLALTGAPPSLEEIRRFEARPAGQRLPGALESILHDRRYADYFAERLARAFVGTEDGPFIRFRRRRFVTWLSDELLANRPYDHIIRTLIADDGLWTERPSTNFVTVTYDPEKKTHDPERLAARTARAVLGVRIDCAQCHDHPFQAWKQRDFQGIAAFFGQVQPGFVGIYDDASTKYQVTNRKTGKPETIEPRVPFLPELWTREGTRRAQLARWATHPKNPSLSRATVNRVWALLFGKPLAEPVDDLPGADELPPVLTLLADDFIAHGYNLRRLIRSIASTEAFQLDSATTDGDASEAQERAWAVFPLTRLRPEQVAGSVFQASSLETIDNESHIIVRLTRAIGQSNFVQRYGDTGEDEFSGGCGTIPQRLLLMNGDLVESRIKDDLFNAAKRIGILAPTDRAAVEVAFLSVLTRRPTPKEVAHFEARLSGTKGDERSKHMTDLFWTLVNSTEFSWNH
jgi:hypothetical protein